MSISDEYHIHYEENRLWEKTNWLGVNFQKFPNDAIIIQELITKTRPNFIIETGSRYGGSALFFASICELIGNGQVFSIDKTLENVQFEIIDSLPCGQRISFLSGESVDPYVINSIKRELNGSVIIFLDSWHTEEYVSQEIKAYSDMVTVGSYLIVEDTHIFHPVPWIYKDLGPMEAVKKFMKNNDEFIADKECEKLGMTANPDGWLRRIK